MKVIKRVDPGYLDKYMYAEIYRQLKAHHWVRAYTAEYLGISIRGLRNYIQQMRRQGYRIEMSALDNNSSQAVKTNVRMSKLRAGRL